MQPDEFKRKVSEGEKWICLGNGGQRIVVEVLEKHDDGATCKILQKPCEGEEYDFPAEKFQKQI